MATKTPFEAPDCPPCPYSPSDSKASAVIKFLTYSRSRSTPENQFKDQVSTLIQKERETKIPAHCKHPIHHAEIVKKSWIDQDIWNPNWKKYEPGPEWLHEAPPRLASVELATRSLAEREKVSERLDDFRDKSRPLHQFLYQVCQTQLRIAEEFFAQQKRRGASLPKDTYSVAYEAVKRSWHERHIWQKEWTILPGIKWLHEYPLETVLRDALGDGCVDNSPEAQKAIEQDKLQEKAAITAGIAEVMQWERAHPNPVWEMVSKKATEERAKRKRKAAEALDEDSENTTVPITKRPLGVEEPEQSKKGRQAPEVPVRRSARLLELERREKAKEWFGFY